MFNVIFILFVVFCYGVFCLIKKDFTASLIAIVVSLTLGMLVFCALEYSRHKVDQKLVLYYIVELDNDSTEIREYNEWLIEYKKRNEDVWNTGLAVPDYINEYPLIQYKDKWK